MAAQVQSPAQFAALEYTSNGILVRYHEVEKRRRKMQSLTAGIDMSYIQMIFEIIAAQGGGDGDWEDDKKQARLQRVSEALKSAKQPTEDKYMDEWVAVQKTIFCPKMDDVPAAIQKAYEAYVGILSIQKEGDHVIFETL